MELRDLLVGGHHGQQLAGLGQARRPSGRRAPGAAGPAGPPGAELTGDVAGARHAAAVAGRPAGAGSPPPLPPPLPAVPVDRPPLEQAVETRANAVARMTAARDPAGRRAKLFDGYAIGALYFTPAGP